MHIQTDTDKTNTHAQQENYRPCVGGDGRCVRLLCVPTPLDATCDALILVATWEAAPHLVCHVGVPPERVVGLLVCVVEGQAAVGVVG